LCDPQIKVLSDFTFFWGVAQKRVSPRIVRKYTLRLKKIRKVILPNLG
jgi:hypothetical protein